MDRALYAAATGMAAQQLNLDVIANNLANADVDGFKGSIATFAELASPGQVGLGTATLGEHIVFTQGRLSKAEAPSTSRSTDRDSSPSSTDTVGVRTLAQASSLAMPAERSRMRRDIAFSAYAFRLQRPH